MKTLDISVVGLSCVDCIACPEESKDRGPEGRRVRQAHRRWGVQNPVGGVRISAGGLGNALVALSGLGLEVGVSTRVGPDMYGDFLCKQWPDFDTSGVRIDPDRPTGFAFILNHENERTPFYSAGANSAFCLADVPQRFIEESRCMLIFFAGALPALDGEPMLELVKRCHAAGTTVILDASDSISADYSPITSYLPYANLVVNREEGGRIMQQKRASRSVGTSKDSPREILESLAHPGSFSAVTRPDGVSFLTPQGEYLDVPSPFHGRPVRDVVGAGDAFRSGLATYIATHQPSTIDHWTEACLWASAASYLYLSRNTDTRPFNLDDLKEAAHGLPNQL